VIVTGRAGAGKTTLARKLAGLLHMPMISRDEIKEGYVGTFSVSHDKLPAGTNRTVTELFCASVRMLLEAQVSLVAEAAFQHTLWQEIVLRWSGVSQLVFIICTADPTLCAQRHLDRGLSDPAREFYHGDTRVKVFRQTGEFLPPGDYDPPAFDLPTLEVSTFDGYAPGLSDIIEFIMRGKI
jgi:hypothetical protein